MQIIIGSHISKLSEKPDEATEARIREASRFEPANQGFKGGSRFITVNGQRQYNKRFQADPYKYLYHRGTRIFPTGLLPKIREILPHAEIIDERPEVPISPHGLTTLRPYQKALVEALLANERSAGEIPTGTGKSIVSAALALSTYKAGLVLITVPSTKLMRQTFATLQEVMPPDVTIGRWGDGKCQIDGVQVIVATIQSIVAGLSDPKKVARLGEVVSWYFDESHGAASASYVKGSRVIPARRRNGLTATWRREDGTELVMEGIIGPLVFQYSPAQAIADGWLVKPRIEMHHFHDHTQIEPKPKYDDKFRSKVIYFHEARNAYVASQIARCVDEGHAPCLVLVESIEHGDELAKLTGAPFVDGQRTKSKDLDRICVEFARGDFPVLIASRIFNVGVDIPEIRSLVLPAGGKSVTTVMQRLGRALRPDEGKDTVLVIDIFDHEPWYLERHAYDRRFTYAKHYPGTVTDIHVKLAA